LSVDQLRRLMDVIIAMAVLGIVLGLMQVAGGPHSPMRFYSNTNQSGAVGWFANRNHMATLMAIALPLSIARTASPFPKQVSRTFSGPVRRVASVALILLVILGLALARSRAGLLLGLIALLLSLPMALAVRQSLGFKRRSVVVAGLAAALTVKFVLYGPLDRFPSDLLSDLRWQIAGQTWKAASVNLPWGTGLGSFRSVYEAATAGSLTTQIINHAHNDYLELWLEAGWLFVGLAGLLVVYILVVGAKLLRITAEPATALLLRAAWISISLLLLHSVADYPMRTTALQAAFAVLLAMLVSRVACVSAPEAAQLFAGGRRVRPTS
jgi:O-antigen ligase